MSLMSFLETFRTKKVNLNQIASLVLLVVVSIIAINIFKAQTKKVDSLQQIKNVQVKKNDLLVRIEDKKKKYELYKQTFSPRDRREIINKITNLAAENRIEIFSLKPREETVTIGTRAKRRAVNKVFFQMAVRVSNYNQLVIFIHKLENDPTKFIVEAVEVRRISVRDSASGTQPTKLDVGLTVSALSLKDL